MQNKVMKFDPATNKPNPYPSHSAQYREWHGKIAWIYNPWTGMMRDARDIGSDVFGLAILVDGENLISASNDFAITSSGVTIFNVSEMEHSAEQFDCAMKCLDENKVPKMDSDGETYSLWGRILAFKTAPQCIPEKRAPIPKGKK